LLDPTLVWEGVNALWSGLSLLHDKFVTFGKIITSSFGALSKTTYCQTHNITTNEVLCFCQDCIAKQCLRIATHAKCIRQKGNRLVWCFHKSWSCTKTQTNQRCKALTPC